MFEKLKAQKEFLDCLVKGMIDNDIPDKLGVIMIVTEHLKAQMKMKECLSIEIEKTI